MISMTRRKGTAKKKRPKGAVQALSSDVVEAIASIQKFRLQMELAEEQGRENDALMLRHMLEMAESYLESLIDVALDKMEEGK